MQVAETAAFEDVADHASGAEHNIHSRTDGADTGSFYNKAASLLSLRLAREARSIEKILNLLPRVMQETKLAIQIGMHAGIPATFHYGLTAREAGLTMREILPKLYDSAVPNLYVCGGASIFRGVLDAVSRYHALEGIWQTMPPMPTARRLSAAATGGSSVYVIGGEYEEPPLWYSDNTWRQYRQLKTTERFDTFTGIWHTLDDMPTARAGCAGCSQNGLVYVLGGRIVETMQSTTERLDTTTGRWECLPAMPLARSGCAASSLLGMIYVFGGKGSDGQILSAVERFDTMRGWWQMLPPMPSPRSACACGVVAGGRLLVAGGFNGTEGLNDVDIFDPFVGKWESKSPMQTWRIGAAGVCAGGKLYVLGGKTGHDRSLLCEYYDPATDTWTWLPPMLERHVYCAGTAAIGSF